MRLERDEFEIADGLEHLDMEAVCRLLAGSYWAAERPRAVIEKSVAGSLCLGLYHRGRQIGFARWITDQATFAYLCDVIIDPEFRGRGLGRWLVESAILHPQVEGLHLMLATRDAHGLYERYGFVKSEAMRRAVRPAVSTPREAN